MNIMPPNLAFSSRRNIDQARCPTVKWSGIQNTLEESESDVLILLDCCASGVCTTDEGNGVTELIAACAYNSTANGVGLFSFTHALNEKLRFLSGWPSFTIGYLYNSLFTEIQSWRISDSRHKKAPVHLVLSQNHEHPRSIRISSNIRNTGASQGSDSGSGPINPATDVACAIAPISKLPEYPRLLFSIRIDENVKPTELSTEFFADWLRELPMSTSLVRVEAGFASDSTILIISVPAAMLAYLPLNSAITLLGTARSKNLLLESKKEKSPQQRLPRAGKTDNSETEGTTKLFQSSGIVDTAPQYEETLAPSNVSSSSTTTIKVGSPTVANQKKIEDLDSIHGYDKFIYEKRKCYGSIFVD